MATSVKTGQAEARVATITDFGLGRTSALMGKTAPFIVLGLFVL